MNFLLESIQCFLIEGEVCCLVKILVTRIQFYPFLPISKSDTLRCNLLITSEMRRINLERFKCRLILSLIEIGPNEWAARKSIIATGNWGQLPKIMIEKKWIAQEPRQEMTFLIVERLFFSSYDLGFWSIIEMLSDDFPQEPAVGLFSRVVEYVLVVEDPSCCWQLPFCRTNAAAFDQ